MVPEMMSALANALGETGPARALILTGAGPAFCVGADLEWLGAEANPGEAVGTLVAAHHAAVRAIRAAPVPVVAAVNGAAAGGGMSLALACDYALASAEASFTAAYFRLGLPPDGGNSAFLARSVGPHRAMELLLSNRRLSAAEALAWGLVAEVVPPERLLDRAREVAAGFAGVPRETLLASRALLDSAAGQTLEAQLDAEEAAMRAAAGQPAFGEALRQFRNRPGERG